VSNCQSESRPTATQFEHNNKQLQHLRLHRAHYTGLSRAAASTLPARTAGVNAFRAITATTRTHVVTDASHESDKSHGQEANLAALDLAGGE